MKLLKQLMIILGTYFIGQILQSVLKLPVPGSVIGLILLFFALQKGIIKIEMIEDVCEFLLSNMSFFFIPAGVGLLTAFSILQGKWLGFIIILITSTVFVWLLTVYIVKFFRRGNADE